MTSSVQSQSQLGAQARRPPPSLPRPNEACWCGSGEKYKRCHKEADYLFLRDEQKRLEATQVLRTVGEAAKPGVTTDTLDALAHETAIKLGAYPSPLNYGKTDERPPFPKSICTSVNEIVCHGV